MTISIALLLGGMIASPIVRSVRAAGAERPTAFGLRINLLAGGEIAPLLNAAVSMRSDWIAQDVRWKDIEPAPGEYHWDRLDSALATARSYSFRILLSVSGTPEWARPLGGDLAFDGPPADYSVFAKFLSQLATRYAGMVNAYEIWPEANLSSRWSSPDGLSPRNYTELLRQAYTAIHSADPMSIVVGGSLAPTATNDRTHAIDDLVFYQEMYAAGAAQHFDALGVRVDGYNNPPGDLPSSSSVPTTTYKGQSSFYFRHYEDVRALMMANGDADTALWITSAGWASSPTPPAGMEYAADVSEEQQAQYLAAALAQAQAQSYVAVILVNNFNYSTIQNSAPTHTPFSLIRADWSARPAFIVLAQLRQGAAPAPTPVTVGGFEYRSDPHVMPNWSPRLRARAMAAP